MPDSADDAPDQRLHPWSWLFELQQHLQQFLLPLVALLFFGSRRQDGAGAGEAVPVPLCG